MRDPTETSRARWAFVIILMAATALYAAASRAEVCGMMEFIPWILWALLALALMLFVRDHMMARRELIEQQRREAEIETAENQAMIKDKEFVRFHNLDLICTAHEREIAWRSFRAGRRAEHDYPTIGKEHE